MTDVMHTVARSIRGRLRPHASGRRRSQGGFGLPSAAPGPICLALFLLLTSCGGAGRMGVLLLYPGPPEEPRIQFLTTFTSEKDLTGGMSAFERFIMGEKDYREIGKPYGVAIHDGKMFICDTDPDIVVIFDLQAKSVGMLGHSQAEGRLRKPVNIAIDEDGTRYVADTGLGRVMVFNGMNNFVRALGKPDVWSPSDVAIAGDLLYVTDISNMQVVVLDKGSGREIRRLGKKGSGKGELFFPTNIELDAEGNLYVSDTGNARVLKFDSEGNLLQQFGGVGRTLGKFVRPKGIAVDRDGRLYVVDAAFENVQIFSPDGKLLLFFGVASNEPGGLNLPAKVAIDYDHVPLFAEYVAPGYSAKYLVLVTSQYGRNKINVYGFIERSDGEDDED